MKKWALAAILSFGTLSSAWAAQTTMPMMDTPSHQQAMTGINHDMAHCQQRLATTQSVPHAFSQLNEHEKAATALELMPNGQSGPLYEAAQKHLNMITG